MTVYTPEVRPAPFSKRQKFDCPNCNHPVSVDNTVECNNCSASFKLQLKEVCGPE